jgi:hypothetical protein
MSPETQKRIQVVLAVALAAAAIRLAIILYERHQENAPPQPVAEKALDPDYYVIPQKLYAYDLKSAQKGLVGHTVWVREGYRYTYYPFDPATHHSDLRHEAGVLGPIERLEITDVVRDASPAPGQQQVMAVFQKEGKSYALPVGAVKGQDFTLYLDDILYIQDPHELYKHWPPETWKAIESHEVKPGMNELQASFTLGVGYVHGTGLGSTRTLTYPNGGKPLVVTFENGRVADIQPGSAQ